MTTITDRYVQCLVEQIRQENCLVLGRHSQSKSAAFCSLLDTLLSCIREERFGLKNAELIIRLR